MRAFYEFSRGRGGLSRHVPRQQSSSVPPEGFTELKLGQVRTLNSNLCCVFLFELSWHAGGKILTGPVFHLPLLTFGAPANGPRQNADYFLFNAG